MYTKRLARTLAALAAVALFCSFGQWAVAQDAPATDVEAQLIAVLDSPDAAPADKALTCKKLLVHGTKNAVPSLAKLLPSPELSSWARIALEVIPDPTADAALREALNSVTGRQLIGVINSIGVRRDAEAVAVLVPKLADTDPEIVAASAYTLGKIGDPAATQALELALTAVTPPLRSAVAEGLLLCAERLLAADQAAEAVRIYDLVRGADVPKQRIVEATRGAILARRGEGTALLAEQLKSPDEKLFAIGLTTARELAGDTVTMALLTELPSIAPERQALVMTALADRGDATALPQVLKAAQEGPLAVRIAAVQVLPRLGNVSCVPVLLAIASEADPALVAAARESLKSLPGDDIDKDLVDRLTAADAKLRLALVGAVGDRRIAAAVSQLRLAADDSDGKVRAAALLALGNTIGAEDLPALIGRVIKPLKPEDADAAKQGLMTAAVRMPDRDACADALAASLDKAPNAAKLALVEILGAVGGPRALAALADVAKTGSPELKDSASAALGAWMGADAGPVLLDVVKSVREEKYKIRVLRGYIRIARQFKLPDDQRLDMCRQALEVCQRPDEKKLVLQVAGRIASPASLAVAVSLLQDATVKKEASEVAIAIGEKIVKDSPAPVADAMQQVVDAAANPDCVAKAKQLAEQAKQ
jgi:HEAT repeat protein